MRGAAAVEFALLLPLLLTLLCGIVEISVLLYDQAVIASASREAARAGIVLRTPKLSVAEIESVALGYAQGALIGFGTSAAPGVSVSQAQDPIFGAPLGVTVTYTYSGLALAGVWAAVAAPIQLSATTVMNHE
jgi:Flp pilus assembly protein TadG